MFLSPAITEILQNEFTPYELSLAKKLANKIRPLEFSHDESQHLITCYIGDDEVYLEYDEENDIDELFCTCIDSDFQDCMHIIVSLYLLNKMSDHKINRKNQISKHKIVKLKLTKGTLNEYRKLPILEDSDSADIWNGLYNSRKDFSRYEYSVDKILLNKASELQINLKLPQWAYFGSEKHDDLTVCIKQNDSDYYIKCMKCAVKSDQLCKHQYEALTHHDVHHQLKNNIKLSYQGVSQFFTKNLGVSQKLFDLAYEVHLRDKKYYAVESEKALISIDDIMLAQEDVSQEQISHEHLHELLEQRTVIQDQNWGNAYLWRYTKSDLLLPEFSLLEGKLTKSKEKLASKIEMADSPKHFSREQRSLYGQLVDEYYHNDHNSRSVVLGFWKLLSDNMERLQENLHYVVKGVSAQFQSPRKSDLMQIYFRDQKIRMSIDIQEDEDLYLMTTKLYINNTEIKDIDKWTLWPLFCYDDNGFAYLYDSVHLYALMSFCTKEPKIILDKDRKQMLNLFSKIGDYVSVSYPDSFQLSVRELDNGERKIYMSEAGNYIVFIPKICYDNQDYNLLILDDGIQVDPDDDAKYVRIDAQESQEFIQFMTEMNDYFSDSYQATGQFYISAADFIKGAWFLDFYESCKTNDVKVFGQENLSNFKFNSNKASVSTSIASGIDWFDVSVDLSFGEEEVPYKTWIEAIINDQKYVKLGDGSLGLLPDEWFDKIKKLYQISDTNKGGLKINHYKYNVIEELFEEVSDDKNFVELKSKFDKIQEANFSQKFSIPESVTAEMRPYQKVGFQWLCTLDQIGFGGCLADDMGLGKTIQMISLLAYQKEQDNGVSLVVVPRSLLFNWIAEIEKFCPDLNYFLHHGPKRGSEISDLENYDVIITTYDTASADIDYLKDIMFNYIILDESQAIKNPNSKRYKAMRVLKSRNKFVMTGTPIENNTFDLYAQFSFINPGIFGSQAQFKNKFSTPIDKEGDADTAVQLKKIIHPFLMRRTKEIVAKDLPAKSENVIYCEMGPQQRKMYEDLKKKIASDIKATIKDEGLAKSKFKILDGLLRLRQICNSPLLLHKELKPSQSKSVKIETLVDILENDLNHHNALVFSQFTSMLALIKIELDKRKISYAYLDGSTRDRKSAVDEFQNDDSIQVFLLSLKAGNTGLNLVKADYVYIVDPWWNPAVEAQAIDRTHRIGQDKNIFAYKMICKDTIEEKIVELQNKKKKISKDIIVSDENVFKSLGKQDLLGLFE